MARWIEVVAFLPHFHSFSKCVCYGPGNVLIMTPDSDSRTPGIEAGLSPLLATG